MWVGVAALAVLAALAGAAELAARALVPGMVRSVVIEQLELPADQQLEVTASGILLPQLIGGTLERLHLSSDEVTIGGITGSADVTATGVPLRGGAMDSAEGTIGIDQAEFTTLLQSSALPEAELTLQAPDASLSGTIRVFGRDLPVGLTVRPEAIEGDLLLTPLAATIGGSEIDLQRLAGFLGSAGEALAGPQRICIADRLPAGVTVTALRIEGTRAVADIQADGRIAVDPALLENGVCPR